MKNFLRAVGTIWQREVIRFWRDKTRIISSLFQPIMFLVIFGAGLKNTLAGGNFGVDFIQFMYPGIIAMGVMGVAFFSTISTVYDREFGFLKEILVAPVSRTAIALGKALGATTVASFQALILLLIAPFIHVTITLSSIPLFLLFMALLGLAIAGLGLLIASLMKSTESFGLVMQVLIFPMFFVSGAFFPLTTAPGWMQIVAGFNPLSYGVDAFRYVLLHAQVPEAVLSTLLVHSVIANVLFLMGFSALMLTAAVIAFNKRK